MTNERELGWDDEIENDGPEFILLPPGDYDFTVGKFERGRFTPGPNSKMPACNQATLELKINSPEHGEVTVFHRLLLHTRTEGFLSNFFAGIGQKKKGEKLRMNWNAVVGATGRCKLVHNKYMSNGEEKVNNQVDTFYEPSTAPQQPTYQQPQQPAQPPVQQPVQPTYQQPAAPNQQAPFPTQPQQPTQPANTPPVVPGQF